MSLLKALQISIMIILMFSLVKLPSLYCDEASTEVVQNMPVTGSVVNKEADADLDDESDEKAEEVKKININNADIEELKTLHGVGPVIARRIMEYRKTHGRFNTIEEIKKVKGIGEKKFKEIKKMITIKNKKGTVLFTDEQSEVVE